MKNDTNILFMGTPQIAATVLKSLLDAGISIQLVITQPDKKVGRKQKIVYSPVKQVAIEHDIEVFQPRRISEDYQKVLDCKPDLIITCAYGQLVPDCILEAPKYGCVNLHGSLLPKYRGGAPIQRAIWNGDTKSGMSLMKMVHALDAGPVKAVQEVEILDEDNSTSIFEKMGIAASKLILRELDSVCSLDAEYIAQDDSLATYAPVIKKEEEAIDLSKSDIEILNQIRALSNEPGAYVRIQKKKWKILSATYKKEVHGEFGQLLGWIDNAYALALHEGVLLVHVCQMEGKPVLSAKDFYNGQGRNLVGQSVE